MERAQILKLQLNHLIAAEKGYAPAQFLLGTCMEKKGVTQSNSLALKWLKASAIQKYQRAYYSLGENMKKGASSSEELQEAIWLELAAANNEPQAQYH